MKKDIDGGNYTDTDDDEIDDAFFYSENNLIMKLLSKITTRISRKAHRAETLTFWISTTLITLMAPPVDDNDESGSTGGGVDGWTKMGKMRKAIASHLGPLRNLLSERVESMPSLLKLEGRLQFLGNDDDF